MELSIIIPVYHSAKNALLHLPAKITELHSKFKEFEIIVVIDNDNINFKNQVLKFYN